LRTTVRPRAERRRVSPSPDAEPTDVETPVEVLQAFLQKAERTDVDEQVRVMNDTEMRALNALLHDLGGSTRVSPRTKIWSRTRSGSSRFRMSDRHRRPAAARRTR
jgi:hypothetical protein